MSRRAPIRKPDKPSRAIAVPTWFRPALLALCGFFLLALFSTGIFDSDFWWQLSTGRYMAQTHRLPVPDPFAYTTASAGIAYPGEDVTRHFNLTHEWLAQLLLYGVYRAAGFAGVVLWRAFLLAVFCALAAWNVWLRTAGFYRSLAAGAACALVIVYGGFRVDRPYLISFALLAATIAILESRRRLWLLPVLMLFWANCHGGLFLGWLAIGAYAAGRRPAGRALWLWGAAAILVSGLNPNGFRVIPVLFSYRSSFLTSTLLEWGAPPLWPPQPFSVLVAGALAVLVYARRAGRLVDWLLLAAFAGAAFSAQRNIPLAGFYAPIVIAGYWPWKRPLPALAQFAAGALLAAALLLGMAGGDFFQFRADTWKYPSGAADFLLAHNVSGRLFNTYEWGGYLIWRLWPRQRVFIDGRALSENLFKDYARILYNHDANGGKTGAQLLDDYGIQTVVMNGFEFVTGNLYLQAAALADPQQREWKLVYRDATALVYMRHPPAGVQPLNSMEAFNGLEDECTQEIWHEPRYPRCARALGQLFSKLSDYPRARRWIGVYLSHIDTPDPQAQDAFRRLAGY
jgi:hypothetical protein